VGGGGLVVFVFVYFVRDGVVGENGGEVLGCVVFWVLTFLLGCV